MIKIVQFLLLISSLLFPLKGMAVEVLGSAKVNNRFIEILDNKTWRYKSQVSDLSNCDELKLGTYFCNKGNWKVVPQSIEAEFQYQVDDRHYAFFIIESLGKNDGVTKEFMAEIAITNAAQGANTTEENVKQHFSKDISIDNKKFRTVAYTVKLGGISFTFLNNIYVSDTITTQAIVYGVGPSVTEKLNSLNEILLENFVVPN
ncbi:MAG: hypothetical protein P8L88_03325 [Paracoccaceae bacterium]|nr:hypothetical protein [Paracoccaceae bacterium]